jgi:hypothetical protein
VEVEMEMEMETESRPFELSSDGMEWNEMLSLALAALCFLLLG